MDHARRRPLRPPAIRIAAPMPWLVLALVTLVLAAVAYGLTLPSPPPAAASTTSRAASFTDVQLHRDEVAFAREPRTYYDRVMGEQRRMGYPLKPFIAVRPPVLAFALAWMPGGERAARLLLAALAVAVAGLWTVRLVAPLGPAGAALAGVAMAGGLVAAFTPFGYLMHECWAGLLIALSLVLYPGEGAPGRSARVALSLAAALAAALVRELALPFLGVMALMAVVDGHRREALWWAGAIALSLLALLGHALAVMRHGLPGDAGVAWVRLGGWAFLLTANRWNVLIAASGVLPALLLPAAFAGMLAWSGPVGRRLALTVLGYAAGFLVVGRPEDTYWGLMIAPLLPLGWAGGAMAALMAVAGVLPVRAGPGAALGSRGGWMRRSARAAGGGYGGRGR